MDASSFQEGFNELVEWLAKRGYSVHTYTDACDSVQWYVKEVHISTRQHAENRLYALLHECGHILIEDNRDRLYQLSYQVSADSPLYPSREKRVALLAEEFEAWKRGERLANRLGIQISVEKYDTQRTRSLMSYIHWAAQ